MKNNDPKEGGNAPDAREPEKASEQELPGKFPEELPMTPPARSDRLPGKTPSKRPPGGAEITPGTEEFPVAPPEFPTSGDRLV